MTTSPNPYHGVRFPAEIIEHAGRPYHCFSLSDRVTPNGVKAVWRLSFIKLTTPSTNIPFKAVFCHVVIFNHGPHSAPDVRKPLA